MVQNRGIFRRNMRSRRTRNSVHVPPEYLFTLGQKTHPVLLDENIDSELVRATIFGRYPPSRLADTIGFINAIARPPDTSFHDEMVEQYGRVRRFLPCLLENIKFNAAPAGETTLEAIRYPLNPETAY